MATVDVRAYGFASTFVLKDLLRCFPASAEPRIEKDRLLAVFGPGRWALAYDFGSVVFVGVEAGERQHVVDALTAQYRSEPHPPLDETFLIESGAAQTEVRFDRVVAPELTLPIAEIVAEVLAQSVAMDYYAGDVLEIEQRIDRMTAQLQSTGRAPRQTREMVQFIGQCIATRNDVISTLALFDKPEATWENEQLDRLWNGLHQMLELGDRYRALEAKLRMFQENIEVLVDLTRQSQTLRLEVLVVVLIVMELAVMIWQWVGPRPG